MRKQTSFFVGIGILACSIGTVGAADFWWINESATGDFGTAANWEDADENEGVPGLGDWALFERGVATATTVKLDGTLNRELDGLRVGVDRVILDLNGNDLDVGDLRVGRDSENDRVVGSLTVEGAGTLTAGALSFPAAGGLLTVTGSGTEDRYVVVELLL